jgi:hypothetical protein
VQTIETGITFASQGRITIVAIRDWDRGTTSYKALYDGVKRKPMPPYAG